MKLHTLKIKDEFYTDIIRGAKTFEVRKNDRDFQVGDLINFEVLPPNYDGKSKYYIEVPTDVFIITYVLTKADFPDGLNDGYVVLGIRKVL